MSRKPGTPNKPKVEYPVKDIPVTTLNERVPTPIIENKYIILVDFTPFGLSDIVNCKLDAYQCQGGVSVTNYRANDGSIVMVYCQAMVKREG